MVSDNWPPDPPTSDTREAKHSDAREAKQRRGSILSELWQDWFEALSDVAYHAHEACDLLAKNGPTNGRSGFFASGPFSAPPTDEPIDMDKLAQCLQSLEPKQAARVMYAVQTMQAMETLWEARRSRADTPRKAAW
jgi:hypothetical protein